MKYTNKLIRKNYKDAGGPEIQRPDDDSVPASHVLIVCLGVVALIAIVIWL